MRVLDEKKMRDFIADRKPKSVYAGILNDWFWTADEVYADGEFKDENNSWTSSLWATPGFKAYMENGDIIEVESYRIES